ncbi:MAG: hypothetical protein QNJ46_17995 [Leptolyngbyaceae cyanobacterium MO_188.B28]|nr:hypothetical protein [Leptolyngbyaceae cyanobacterium MO_188.B28]
MSNWLARSAIYIRIQPDWLSVRAVMRQGEVLEYADIPAVVLKKNMKSGSLIKILEVGSSAKSFPTDVKNGIIQCYGFENPSGIVDNFDIVSETLKAFIRKTLKGKRFIRAPRMIIHPLGKFEGYPSHFDTQSLLEIVFKMSGGHSEVYFYTGRELSDEELLWVHQDKMLASRKPTLINLLRTIFGIIY